MEQTGQALPATIQRIWRASAAIWALVILIAGLLLIAAWHFWHWSLWLAIGAMGFAILQLIFRLALVPYRYRFWRYNITPTAAHVIDGVTRSVADQLRNQILQLAQEARNE